MKIPLSNRLLACCGYVKPGDRVADVGCDHGYLGIYLLKNGIASAVIASDVREMPLQSAVRNAEKFGVKEHMSFYLSDGIRDVPREFDCMVCAGMGADTMMSILDAATWLKSERYRLILQCQSKRPELRRYLYRQGHALRPGDAGEGREIHLPRHGSGLRPRGDADRRRILHHPGAAPQRQRAASGLPGERPFRPSQDRCGAVRRGRGKIQALQSDFGGTDR